MNTEFKKISSSNNQTVYVLEDASSGGPSAGSIATVSKPLGGVRKRGQNLIAQEDNKDKVDASKPRNFVAKNAKTGGAGAHKDKKKAAKQGDVKHKKPFAEAFQNDEANLYYRYDTSDGRLKKRMVDNNDERQAFAQGFKDTPELALRAAGIIRSKFDPKKFIQNQGGKWVQVFPYGEDQGVSESERRMSRAAKGYEKYGKKGMMALAKAGREGASDDKLDKIRNKHDHYNEGVAEGWSQKYKSSINCSHPKGFSQKAHCAGKKKHNEDMTMEAVCPDCGMCQTHGNLNEIKKGAKDSNGFTKCWPGHHAVGTKKGKNGGQVRNCVPNEDVAEDHSTATGGWGQGAYATASTSSKWNGAGRDDSVHENPDWYNDEANSMSTSQLKSLYKHAIKLRRAVKAMQTQGDTLEPWQQSKVTKAADYLDAVFNAVDDDYDMGENVQPHEEDQYMAELQAKLNEKIPKNAPVDVWIKDFEKSNAPQFKGKTQEKRRQMAVAASYGAKNPSKKKK